MLTSDLQVFFKSCLSEFPGEKPESVFSDFEDAIKNKKYDIQDMTIIEAILKEEGDSLKESFIESFGNWINKTEISSKSATSANWTPEKSTKSVEIFCACLETLVNYYYNNTIAGQFS